MAWFAGRVQGDTALQVGHAWQLAIGREPNEHERQLSVELVDTHGLAVLCRGLFNANEFVQPETSNSSHTPSPSLSFRHVPVQS